MIASKLLPTSIKGTCVISYRSICHKSKLKPKKNNYHWPYERRSYNYLNFLLDPITKGKFDENSKIIQVDGNLSAGKEQFAKQLAEELGMIYWPQPDLIDYCKNRHGFDYRALNPLLPERLRICDWEMFHENPARHSVIHMQHNLQRLRAFSYGKALAHLFNTGQGVVMTRTVFTERAIVEAMHECGWLPKAYIRGDGIQFYDWKHRYIYVRNVLLGNMLKPHLTIYLDTPVETCLDRIKNDPDPMIANSNAHTKEFLEEIETAFKNIVLPKQDHNGVVMVIDHPEHKKTDEILDIIDDIEDVHFEYDVHDTKFESWDDRRYFWHFDYRRWFTSIGYASDISMKSAQPYFDIAGMGDSISQGDLILRDSLYNGHVIGRQDGFWTDDRVHGIGAVFGKVLPLNERIDNILRADYC